MEKAQNVVYRFRNISKKQGASKYVAPVGGRGLKHAICAKTPKGRISETGYAANVPEHNV